METAQAPLIKLDGVSKVFLTDEVETHALSSIHLQINAGEYVAIAGPSGCGKTTLLSLLGLLDTPSGGEYFLDGKPVATLSPSERARIRNREIGFIFQAFNLISELTIVENVEVPLFYQAIPKIQRRERAIEKLKLVGLGGRPAGSLLRPAVGPGRPAVAAAPLRPGAAAPLL